jgi:hypothetical protein
MFKTLQEELGRRLKRLESISGIVNGRDGSRETAEMISQFSQGSGL